MKFAYSPMDKDIGLRIREFKDMRIENLQGKLNRIFGENRIKVTEDEDAIRLSGELDSWQDIVNACTLCVQKHEKILLPLDSFRPEGIDSNDHFHGFKDQKKSKEYMMKPKHVVNDIRLKDSPADIPMRIPELKDESLEGERPDVLIIGGGISGVTIARELVRWKLKVLLVEKESDLALHASGRNDGEVHPGIDLGKGSLKQHYVVKGNEYMEKVCKELNVPFVFTEFGTDTMAGLHKLPSIMWSEEYQKEYLEMNFRVFDSYEFVQGELAWNFADFQSTEGIMRVDGNHKGVFTRVRQPKAAAVVFKDRWEKKNELF